MAKLEALGSSVEEWLEVPLPDYDDDDDGEPRCTNKAGHSFVCSDDDSYMGEGRCYCEFCGADGDG